MAKNDFQYAGWNSYALQCGRITTLISSGDCTLQCGIWLWIYDSEFTKWLWDDMPLNSPKRPPYWNSTYGFHLHTSPQSTCHFCTSLQNFIQIGPPSAEENDVMSIFKMADLRHLGLKGSNNGFFEKPS